MWFTLHSNGFVHMPNFFEMIVREIRLCKRSKWPRNTLKAMGLPHDAINQIAKGKFTHHVEGDTVVLKIL